MAIALTSDLRMYEWQSKSTVTAKHKEFGGGEGFDAFYVQRTCNTFQNIDGGLSCHSKIIVHLKKTEMG